IAHAHGDIIAKRLEQRRLDPRRVILFELGNLFEQLGAAGIVEESAGKTAGPSCETIQYRSSKFAARGVWPRKRGRRRPAEVFDDGVRDVALNQASLGSRKPMNCQR